MARDFAWLERRRMRAAELFARGLCQAEVARQLGVSAQSAGRWHKAWQEGGKEALRAAGRAGRCPRLTCEQLEELQRVLLTGPCQCGYGTDLWTLPRIAEVIRRLFGVRYHPAHVWKVLRKLGWSCQKPATRARERDEGAIRRWLKESWPRIKKGRARAEPR